MSGVSRWIRARRTEWRRSLQCGSQAGSNVQAGVWVLALVLQAMQPRLQGHMVPVQLIARNTIPEGAR